MHVRPAPCVIRGMRGIRAALFLCLALSSAGFAESASSVYRKARRAEKEGRMAEAFLLYSQAAALAPANRLYWAHSQAVQSRAALEAKLKPARRTAAAGTPSGPVVSLNVSDAELALVRRPQPPKELRASEGTKSFDLRGNARFLFQEVSQAFGLDVVFDGDYQAGPSQRFRLADTDYRRALEALQRATGSFLSPITDRVALVAKDTTQKRAELEPTVAVVIPIPHPVSAQEAQEMARTVQQVMDIRRFAVDNARRLVFINDRISKVRPAQMLFEDLLYHRSEVAIDVEFLEVDRSDMLNYGIVLPTQISLVGPGTVSLPMLTKGLALFGLLLGDARVIARMSRTAGNTLIRTQVRAVDGQPTTFHVGDRYPVLTGGYFGPLPAETTGANAVYRPPPSFSFEDLGLVLKITPKVHGVEDVSMEVEAEFKVLGGEGINGIPIIANRKFNSRVRLQQGQWAVVAGLMNSSEARSISGIVGLSNVPALGPLMRNNQRDRSFSEVLLLLRPRLLSLPPDQGLSHEMAVGTETRPRVPL